jgi:hypothetical protein
MQQYIRRNPEFSLCGLNCVLCPRLNTTGSSKCPGCGGPDFYIKHPSCKVINCSKKNGEIEYCFECKKYPCERYNKIGKYDSFITYMNVISDIERAKEDIEGYLKILNIKKEYLDYFLEKFNDGRSKGFYCTAINILPVEEVEDIVKIAKRKEGIEDIKRKAKEVRDLFKETAKKNNLKFELRK